MISVDSKLFYGAELGKLSDVLAQCRAFLPLPSREPDNLVDEVGWINTQLADGLFLEVTYPIRDCPESEMIAHINLIDDDKESWNMHEIANILLVSAYDNYKKFLSDMSMEYKEPVFYTRHYVYST